jgi:Ca-activated chloride channel family protein
MNAAQTLRYLSLLLTLLLTACGGRAFQHNRAGNRLFDRQEYPESIYEYHQAQVDNPEQAEPFYNAANAYNRIGELDAVQTQTLQALEVADPELAAQTWFNLGNAFFDAGKFASAVDAYKEALRLQPDDLDAKHNLELALLMEQQQEKEEQQSQPEQENSGEEQSVPEETAQPAPDPEEGTEEPQEQPQTGESSQDSEPSDPGELSPEQAEQLLEVLLSDNPTLQEYLNQVYEAPDAMPKEDW